ncbi:rRNA-processing protein UTP23-like protein [Thalictrum thalictroides]|uniref:rRNA-processing protein UTP23-like protein n=1 Tax=Thalictrum thalictroides TaxID=46969 RepID=A0A7J6UX13_THATH|nr:rRNA-processing protein UTP23-like protein [Thalictrum thalictroides]
MKVKKQKRHRRIVRFYSACFGIREPFKILCDGTFIHHLLTNKLTPAGQALSNILGGSTQLFTTRCIIAELKSLGASHSDSYHEACSLITARCDHEKRVTGVQCIEEVIGEDNSEHFFVATQDSDLKNKLQEVSFPSSLLV